MKLFNTYGPCFGISIYRWKQFTIELWFVPPGYSIPKHSHPREDIELYHVFGKAVFCREFGNDLAKVTMPLWSKLKHFTVPQGWDHWFETNTTWLVFFNVAKWDCLQNPTSASKDFQLAK